jgi:8-oxo-dGTP pyrophosphatase MutT (NUDIX family)
MGRVEIPKEQILFLNNLTKAIEQKLNKKGYLVTEADIAEKYKVDVENVILKLKEAIPFEIEDSPKIRRAKILNNFWTKGLNYYEENHNGLKSDFTDALIVKNGKMLFLQRTKDSKIEPGKWGLAGGHLEKFLSQEKNVLKEVKEETGLDIIDCKLINVKDLAGGRKIYYFLCIPTFEGEVILNNDEHSNYKWMSIQDIKDTPEEDFMFDLKKYILEKLLGIKNK